MDTRSPAPHLAQASADDGRGPRPLRVAPARRRRRPALVLVGLLLILVGAAAPPCSRWPDRSRLATPSPART